MLKWRFNLVELRICIFNKLTNNADSLRDSLKIKEGKLLVPSRELGPEQMFNKYLVISVKTTLVWISL